MDVTTTIPRIWGCLGMSARKCEVCDTSLEGRRPSAKTCSDNCRTKLALRRKTARVNEIDEAAKSAVGEAVQERVREYVDREVLTEDLLERIKTMVGLAPEAIAAIQGLMASEDAEVSLRAAQTILRYTMGNPSVAPPSLEKAPLPMSISFNLPRPGEAEDAPTLEATELRQCNDCGIAKPESDFVAGSSRCTDCFEQIQQSVHNKLAPRDHTA